MQQFGSRVSVAGARRQLEQSFATTATAVRVALSQTVQMAETVNQLAERVSNALDIQNDLNGHIQLGILTLNQQVALVQEQVDYLWTFQQLIMLCVLLMALYCMLLQLNRHMRGVWNTAFVNFTTQLVVARWLQCWSGSLALSVLGILGLGLCVWVATDGQYFMGRMPPKTGTIRGLFPRYYKIKWRELL